MKNLFYKICLVSLVVIVAFAMALLGWVAFGGAM
jgi:hypothetical protein